MKNALFIGFLLSFAAYAEEGFFTDPSQHDKWNIFTKANFEKSVVKLEDRSGGTCTGSFISNDGYLLTAAHCLEKCLEGIKGTKNRSFDPLYNISLYDHSLLAGRICAVRVAELGLRKASIVYIGTGSAGFEDNHIEKIPSDIRTVLSGILDFAIIKFDTPKRTKCLKLSSETPFFGDEVMSIGHPGKARRRTNSSDGRSKYFGFGQIRDGLMSNAIYTESKFSSEKILMLEEAYNLQNYYVTSSDLVPGYSGGPTLNLKGEIIGVNTNLASFADYDLRYVADSAIVMKTSTLKNILSEEQFEKYFSCENAD